MPQIQPAHSTRRIGPTPRILPRALPVVAAGLAALGLVVAGCASSSHSPRRTGAEMTRTRPPMQSPGAGTRAQRVAEQVNASPTADPDPAAPGKRDTIAQFDQPAADGTPAGAPIDAARDPGIRATAGTTPIASHPTGRPGVADLTLYGHMPGVAADLGSLSDAASNLQQVSFTEEGADFDPEVDPTGSFIAYASTRHRNTSDLYLKRVGGSTVMQLTDDPANDMMPTFSPDGRYVAFTSDRSGNWDIYILDTQGTAVARQVTTNPGHDVHPSFSPDGEKLVYCTYSAQSGQWEMVVVNTNGTPQPSFIGYGLNPVWSPTQDRILFQRARERGTRWFSVWTCDLTPNGEAVAFTEVASSANAAVITPTWSPDGRHIAFTTVLFTSDDQLTESAAGGQPRHADIWVMNADGTGRTMLTGGQFANLQPTWSPTGDVLFISDRARTGVDNVWSVRPQNALRLAGTNSNEPRFPGDTQGFNNGTTAAVPTNP